MRAEQVFLVLLVSLFSGCSKYIRSSTDLDHLRYLWPGNTKGGSITVPLTSCLTVLDWPVFQIKTKTVSVHTADSKPVKQEVNGIVILPPLVFPAMTQAIINRHACQQVCERSIYYMSVVCSATNSCERTKDLLVAIRVT